MTKKGLAVIYDPHNLLQFIWYYCTYGLDKEWDALCLPNGDKGQYMNEYCEKCGIFSSVITDDKAYLNAHVLEQAKIFAKMFGYFCIGKQERFCKKLLNEYVNINDYDEINVLADYGVVSGACIGLSNIKKVVILEDGTSDYVTRNNKYLIKNIKNPSDWKGFLLANMGYANVGHTYPLKTTKNCLKCSSNPSKMYYKDYKDFINLYDFNKTDISFYEAIVKKTYGDINRYDFESADTILLTTNLKDFVLDVTEYIKIIEKYISETSQSIIIKRHPRDEIDYEFSENVFVQEISQSIPAEVILPYIKNKRLVFFYPSSTMLYADDNYRVECLYFDELYEESLKQNTMFNYFGKEKFIKSINSFNIKNITFRYF